LFRETTTRCCAAPIFLNARPLLVKTSRQNMSAVTAAFTESGHEQEESDENSRASMLWGNGRIEMLLGAVAGAK